MISGAARAGHGDATTCGRSPTTHTPPKERKVPMIYHLHLTKDELFAVLESLQCRWSDIWDLEKEALKEPNELTPDIMKIYARRKRDIHEVIHQIDLLIKVER